MPSAFQNANRYEDTLEHCGAELLMLKNWMLVCSKAKMETRNQSCMLQGQDEDTKLAPIRQTLVALRFGCKPVENATT